MNPPPTVDTWVTIAEADVLASINNSELTAALTAALANGQAGVIGVLIPDVTMEVRGYCRVRNTLATGTTVPQELKNAAIDIIIYRAACRVNKAADAKKPMNDAALLKLAAVAEGKIRISSPVTPTADATSAEGPAMPYHVPRRFGYDEERGI